ncbi:MAG: DMT family transporter [Saprospiraceae bacterium]|nr:DMT family transporter [Saprospiraceae bacterium]
MFSSKLQLHIAVILFGLTAVLGKAIQLNAIMIVWWRMLISLVVFAVIFSWIKPGFHSITLSAVKKLLGIGCIIALHWFCFYGAVKLSHVSIALMCMSLTPLFTSIIEPMIGGTRTDRFDLIVSMVIIPFVYLMIGGVVDFSIIGFVIGLLAALLAALFSVLNKKIVHEVPPSLISFYEFVGVFLFATPAAIYFYFTDGVAASTPIGISNILLMLTLSVICTNVAFWLSVNALKGASAFEANLIIGLEPVYGILLSFVVFKEHLFLKPIFYAASLVIIAIVFFHPFLKDLYHAGKYAKNQNDSIS